MTVQRAILLVSALLAASATAAADLPRRSAAPAYEPPPPPVFTWTGFYVGVQGGYGFGSFTDGGSIVGAASGGLVGGTVGYNYQVAPHFVLGGEVDFSFAGISGTGGYPGFGAYGAVDNLLTARLRGGYAWERALFYVTGGFAGASNAFQIASWRFGGSQSIFQAGWALGAGVEYAITPNISAKGEYLYTSTGPSSYFDTPFYALQSGANMSAVRAGVNYHF
jgi:outer membrane immunogenic protein